MRVLVVTNMYPTPSAPWSGTFVHQQVQSLQRSGVEVECLFLDRLREGRGVYRGLGRRVLERAAASRVHAVHVMYGGVMADAITRTQPGVPVIVSFCGSDLLGNPEARRSARLSSRFGVMASRRASQRAAGVIVKSENLRSALPPLDADRVWLIPNGVDLERFRPMEMSSCRRELGWEPDLSHVLFPSRPDNRVKRFGLAEEAVADLAKAGSRVRLHALDRVPHERVPIYLNASDCLLLTSAHEGSPNIVKEALACNRPVVSVDVGDVRERIEGVVGCAVTSDHAEELAQALRRALDPPRPSAREVTGRARMGSLSLDAVAARIGEVYARVCDGFLPESRAALSRMPERGRTA